MYFDDVNILINFSLTLTFTNKDLISTKLCLFFGFDSIHETVETL